MRVIRHPLVARDITALVDQIIDTTDGNFAAATRRLDESDARVCDIIANPVSFMRHSWTAGRLAGPARRAGTSHHLRIPP